MVRSEVTNVGLRAVLYTKTKKKRALKNIAVSATLKIRLNTQNAEEIKVVNMDHYDLNVIQ